MAFAICFSPIPTLNSHALALPFVSPSPFAASYVSTLPSASTYNAYHLKLKHLPRTSEEVPVELAEDSKFVPLNADEPQYGPPALLLLGFEVEEIVKIQQLLKDLDGEFLQIIFCTEEMITRSLWEAMNTKQPNLKKIKMESNINGQLILWMDKAWYQIAKSLPRICFLSGLTGEEMMMFIDAFPETGLEPAVFAALVPNSADKPLQEVIEEIMGDHEMLTSK